ncbi:MAG: hypothetical protein U9Q81_02215 [Pseudomonadota bacterium]|nr:hypothetical protein [Pseudomonadota bacterium]
MTARQYDHNSKAGNRGDVAKHPALVAAIKGLLAGHEGLFRYADSFAGRWEYNLSQGGVWTQGIERFAAAWKDGHPDVQFWREQWSADPDARYPGSTQLAKGLLDGYGPHEIRAFERVDEYATGLRGGLGEEAVFQHTASARDWAGWRPDLLFIDPPGLHSGAHPDYPTLTALLASAKDAANVLMWLPMTTAPGQGGPIVPLAMGTIAVWSDCLRAGHRVLAVRWHNADPLCGCLLVYRFDSGYVEERVGMAVRDVVGTMGEDWRVV